MGQTKLTTTITTAVVDDLLNDDEEDEGSSPSNSSPSHSIIDEQANDEQPSEMGESPEENGSPEAPPQLGGQGGSTDQTFGGSCSSPYTFGSG